MEDENPLAPQKRMANAFTLLNFSFTLNKQKTPQKVIKITIILEINQQFSYLSVLRREPRFSNN